MASGRASRGKSADSRGSSTNLLRSVSTSSVGGQLHRQYTGEYYRAWLMVVTWGVLHGEARLLLPRSLETLQSLTVELLIAGSSVKTIKNVWCAIEDRPRMTGHVLPLAKPMLFRRMVKAQASGRGSPGRLIFPISAEHVQELLRMTGQSVNQTRRMLAICLETVLRASVRAGEPSDLQLTWGLDQAFGPEHAEGAGVRSFPGNCWSACADGSGNRPGGHPPYLFIFTRTRRTRELAAPSARRSSRRLCGQQQSQLGMLKAAI